MRKKMISANHNQRNILKAIKSPHTKQVSVKVPLRLVERIENIKRDAMAMGYIFSVSEICVHALGEAAELAERELQKFAELKAGVA